MSRLSSDETEVAADCEYVSSPHSPFSHTDLHGSIIFVHGLFGHPQDTWTYKSKDVNVQRTKPKVFNMFKSSKSSSPALSATSTAPDSDPDNTAFGSTIIPPLDRPPSSHGNSAKVDVFWPQDLLIPSFPKARILTRGYDADLAVFLGSTSQATLRQHAENLLGDVAAVRAKGSQKKRPIIFVTHSLGGLVVKDALGQADRTVLSHQQDILPSVKGIMFVGTPHRGANAAKIGEILCKVYNVVEGNANTQLLQSLNSGSVDIARISDAFAPLLYHRTFKIHSFREEKETDGHMIVDDYSSTIGDADETKGLLLADHVETAKFYSVRDANYGRVHAVLDRWIDGLNTAGTA